LRGKLWALAQRPAVLGLVRASSAVIVTADFRADWLNGRWWLPRRDVRVAPVFSNLPPARPPPGAQAGANIERDVVGLFGYSYGGVAIEAVLDALRLLRRAGRARSPAVARRARRRLTVRGALARARSRARV